MVDNDEKKIAFLLDIKLLICVAKQLNGFQQL